jgi:mono/diheme cytochrome c family protein
MPNTNRVLVYKLDGGDKLPNDVFPQITLPPPPPLTSASAETIKAGAQAFTDHCFFCHGGAATGDKVHPDLRFSDILDPSVCGLAVTHHPEQHAATAAVGALTD